MDERVDIEFVRAGDDLFECPICMAVVQRQSVGRHSRWHDAEVTRLAEATRLMAVGRI